MAANRESKNPPSGLHYGKSRNGVRPAAGLPGKRVASGGIIVMEGTADHCRTGRP
jgi:hypothetical protein